MGIGLVNEATINIKFNVDETELKSVKSAFAGISKALNLQKAIQDFNALEKVVEKMEQELKDARDETKRLSADMASQIEAATKKVTSATNRRIKSLTDQNNKLKETIRTERQAQAEAIATARAEERATAAKNKKTAATRAANAEAREASQIEKMVAVALTGEGAAYLRLAAMLARVKTARDDATAASKRAEAAAAKVTSNITRETAARAANHAEMRRQQYYEALISVAMKQSQSFLIRNAQLINRIKQARMEDIDALRKYATALKTAIGVENQAQARRQGVDAFGRQIGFVETLRSRVEDAEKSVDALFRASYRLTMVGHTLRRFSQDIFRIGGEIMTTFGDFEYMLNRARGAMQVFTGDMIEGKDGATLMRDAVVDLSMDLKMFPAQEVAQGLYFWGSATGQVIDQTSDLTVAMKGLDSIMKAAAMTNTSYEQTIKGVYSILTQFYGGALDQADYVTQQLFYTTQTTAAEFMDLIQAFKMVGPVAAQMGVTFEEVNETFGKLSDLGIRGTMAGRAMRQMFIQALRPSGPAIKAIENAWRQIPEEVFGGMNFKELVFPEGEFVGISKYIEILAKATEHADLASRDFLITSISTANMLPVMSALIAKQTAAMHGLDGETKRYTSTAQKAEEFFAENWRLLSNSWNALRATIDRVVDAIRINIGAVVSEALRPFIEAVEDVLKSINAFIKQNPQFVAAVGKMVAILGAGAGLAGVLTVVAGSLTGLGAAVIIATNVLKGWFQTLGSIVGTLGIFATAVIDNIEYIRGTAIKVIENLTGSFGDLESGMANLADLFASLIAPARELMGIFVRVMSDIVLRISELVGAAREIPFVTEALDGLVKVLGFLVSASIVTGVIRMTAAILGLTGVAVVGGITRLVAALRALTAINLVGTLSTMTTALGLAGGAIKGLATAAIARNVAGVGVAVRGLGTALGFLAGPAGVLAGLAVAGGFLAYELFPPFRDIVDDLTSSFRNLREEIAKNSEEMGASGPVITASTLGWATAAEGIGAQTRNIREIESQRAKQQAIVDKILERKPKLREQVTEEGVIPKGSKRLRAAMEEVNRLTGDLLVANAGLDRSRRDVELIAQAAGDFIIQSYKDYAAGVGDGFLRGEDEYYADIRRLVSEFGMKPLDAAATVRRLYEAAPEFLTPEELRKILTQGLSPILSGFQLGPEMYDEAMAVLEESLGEGSSAVNQSLKDSLQKVYRMTDPEEIGAFLHTIQEGQKYSFEQMLSRPEFSDIHPAIVQAFTEWANRMEQNAEGSVALREIESRLQDANKRIVDKIADIMAPDMSMLSEQIYNLSWNKDDWDELASVLLNATMGDGSNLLDAIVSGEAAIGPSGPMILEMAKALSGREDIIGPELASALEKATADAVDDANLGENIRKGLRAGIRETLSGDLLTKSDLAELRKKGSTASQIRKNIAWLGSAVARDAMSGNIQMRGAGREQGFSIIQMIMDNLVTSEGRKREGRVERGTIRQLKNLLPNMPKVFKDAIREQFISLGEEGILTEKQIQKLFPKVTLNLEDVVKVKLPASEGLGGLAEHLGKGQEQGKTLGGWFAKTLGIGDMQAEAQGFVDSVSSALSGADYGPVEEAAKPAGRKAMAGARAGIREQVGVTGVTMSTAMNTSSTQAAGKQLGGQVVAASWAKQVISGVMSYTATISSGLTSVIGLASILTSISVGSYGQNVGKAWGQGVVTGIEGQYDAISTAIGNAPKDGKGTSPPKTGPLKHIDKWGENVGKAWGEGYRKGTIRETRKAARDVRRLLREEGGAGNTTFTSNNKKEIRITLDVQSKDGSVDRAKTSQLRRAVMDALALADLEHMVTVG